MRHLRAWAVGAFIAAILIGCGPAKELPDETPRSTDNGRGDGDDRDTVPEKSDPAALENVTQPKDRAGETAHGVDSVDDDLRQLLRLHDVSSPAGLARLARLDGATIVDTDGQVIAYGAVVRSTDSQGEGARSAAARTLSTVANVALSVSHDGPITVYRGGRRALEIL